MERRKHAADSRPVRANARAAQRAVAADRARLKVFIFSEHAIYCDGLERSLAAHARVRIVGTTANWPMAIHAVRARRPDVVLLDAHMPLSARGRIVFELLAACPSARIIMLAPQIDERVVSEALRLGIRGVLSKNVRGDVLAKSVRAVAAGQHWIDREILIRVVQARHGKGGPYRMASDREPFGLTARELEIVSIVLGGGSNKQIGRSCSISEKTVKRHLTNIFDKLGLSNRLELAVFALEHRLVTRQTGHSFQHAEAV